MSEAIVQSRREFLVIAVAVPLIEFGSLFLPATTWSIFATVGHATSGFTSCKGRVTPNEASELAAALSDEWEELPWWFRFSLGIDRNDISKNWLLGDGWQYRVRRAIFFFDDDGFRIEQLPGGVRLRH